MADRELPTIEVPEDPDEAQRLLIERVGGAVLQFDNARRQRDLAKQKRLKAEAEHRAFQEAERRRVSPTLDDLEIFTEEELGELEIEPVEWLVDNLMPVGLWICSAAPKIGKSFLMTALCRAVATGTMFANFAAARQGSVLYLDLEGTKRRAQVRQRRVRGDWEKGSPDFRSVFRFPVMDTDGLAELDKAITKWNLRLVVIDVWAAFRSMRQKNEDANAYDRRAIAPIVELCKARSVTIVLVHHNRKQSDADQMSEVSGSNAMTGAADGIMTIRRGRFDDTAVINVMPRDADELELAAKYQDGLWTIVGDAKEYFGTEARRTVHGILTNAGAPGLPSREIIELSELPKSTVMRTLRKMLDEHVVRKANRGHYALIFTAAPPSP